MILTPNCVFRPLEEYKSARCCDFVPGVMCSSGSREHLNLNTTLVFSSSSLHPQHLLASSSTLFSPSLCPPLSLPQTQRHESPCGENINSSVCVRCVSAVPECNKPSVYVCVLESILSTDAFKKQGTKQHDGTALHMFFIQQRSVTKRKKVRWMFI